MEEQKLSDSAIALLRKVQKTITEEPNRLNMGQWARQFNEESVGELVTMPDEIRPHEDEDVERPVPACGTVGCIAGWTAIHGLTNLPTVVINGHEMVNVYKIKDVESEASKLLGITKDQGERLFLLPEWNRAISCGHSWPEKFAKAYEVAQTAEERAKVTNERIDYFIETLL